MIVQKLKKGYSSDLKKAIMYYTLLSVLNNINLTTKQVELLAFTSLKGTITSPSARKEFIDTFKSSLASLENIKGGLTKMGWLVKIDNKYRINPRVSLDFSKDIVLQINMTTTDGTV